MATKSQERIREEEADRRKTVPDTMVEDADPRTPSRHDDGHTAAAPLGTDAEAGGEGPVPRGGPADTYLVDSGGEVRAGGNEHPAHDPFVPPANQRSQSKRVLVGLIAAGLLVLLVIFLFAA